MSELALAPAPPEEADLGAALDEEIDARLADLDAGGDESRARLLDLVKEYLAGEEERLHRDLLDEASGPETARRRSAVLDAVLGALARHVTERVYPLTNPTSGEHLALVAVGGYGRGELAPFSDIDLLFLLPYKQTPWGEQVVEHLLYLLWDLGLKVGHATRSVDECVSLARGDASIRTALLEARYLWGDLDLYRSLRHRFEEDVVVGTGPAFVEAKLAERDARHRRMGDSRYLLEPNVKDGKGGLRDLHTLFWIGKYLYRVDRVAELVDCGVLSGPELRRFKKAEAFLWTVRCHLHDLAGRAEERLTFDVQSEIGRRLGYTDHAGARGVERFMKHYFLVAKDVGDLTRIFCAAIEEQHKRKPRFSLPRLAFRKRQIEGFQLEGDRLSVTAEDEFAREPVRMMQLFQLAEEHGLDIHPRALRLVTRNLKLVDARYRADPEANRLFMEILTGRRDPETALRRMNEAGLLGRFLPDFGRVVAQMQHDMYHVYTVDEHTIRAIGLLSQIEQGLLAEDHPLSNSVIHKIASRKVLYLAVLLHDIAKGRGGDHSEIGARIALKLGPRLGLDQSETETTSWLVRHHLLMSGTAFKRDIADPKTVADFVAEVQGLERLRLLVVLTVVDIRAVGPGRWNGWKGQLLRDLYNAAEDLFTGGHGSAPHQTRVAGLKASLAEKLGHWPAKERERHLSRLSDSYWLGIEPESFARHAELMRAADVQDAPLTIDMRPDDFKAVTEVVLYTPDHPGLFAATAGAMALCGANIVDAKIFTTSDGMAFDTFLLQDGEGLAFAGEDKLAKLRTTIETTLAGRTVPHRLLAKRREPKGRSRVFTVAPQVFVDNVASNTHTVIEVNGRDRPGFLYDVTRTLTGLGVSISSAHITTFGARAVDVFYVKDVFGLKITHEGKLKKIRATLLAALAPETRPEKPKRAARPATAKAKAAAPKAKAAGPKSAVARDKPVAARAKPKAKSKARPKASAG